MSLFGESVRGHSLMEQKNSEHATLMTFWLILSLFVQMKLLHFSGFNNFRSTGPIDH